LFGKRKDNRTKMKDSELRAIVLQKFYEERRRTVKIWVPNDVPAGIDAVDFFDVCSQLAQHGLIDWSPQMEMFKIKSGRGKITAGGVDVIERTATSPITITLEHHQAVSITGSNNIVGNHNSINVDEISTAISHSSFSEAEKAEAKSLLQKIGENKLLNTVLGSVAGAATKHALEAAK